MDAIRNVRHKQVKNALLLGEHSNRITVSAGTVLLAEGVKSGRVYVLEEGTLEVARGDTPVALVSERGAIFGEMSLLLDSPHTATVRAITPAVVHEFTDGAAFFESDPETALVVARLLAQRLQAATSYLVDLKRQYAGHENHLAMVSDVLASLINQQRGEFLPGSERQDASTT
jgi:CRP-like cAMP-binding protein